MHFISQTLLIALGLGAVASQPHGSHKRFHAKRDIYDNPALYTGVVWSTMPWSTMADWNTVNYGGQPTSTPTSTPQVGGNQQAASLTSTSTVTITPSPVIVQPAAAQNDAAQQASQNNQNSQNSQNSQNNQGNNGNNNNNGGNTNTQSTTPNSSPGTKRGLAYDNTSPNMNIFSQYQNKLSWGYNWVSSRGSLPTSMEYIPMLHSTDGTFTGLWSSDVDAAKSAAGGNTLYLMSFNEPDQTSQSNMSPGAAAAAFGQYMSPHSASNVKLGAPSVSNGVGNNGAGNPMGIDWLKSFMGSCSGCPIDFVNIHWYGCDNGCSIDDDVKDFQSQVGKASAIGKPVWVTEFGAKGDADRQEQFMGQILPWLDGYGGVERYSYFMAKEGILTQGNGVSGLGQKYATS